MKRLISTSLLAFQFVAFRITSFFLFRWKADFHIPAIRLFFMKSTELLWKTLPTLIWAKKYTMVDRTVCDQATSFFFSLSLSLSNIASTSECRLCINADEVARGKEPFKPLDAKMKMWTKLIPKCEKCSFAVSY